MIKILAFKYPTVVDVDTQRKIEPISFETTIENIQQSIRELLFEKKFNYLLINLENKLYICEVVDVKKNLYSHRTIEYHPDMDKIYNKK